MKRKKMLFLRAAVFASIAFTFACGGSDSGTNRSDGKGSNSAPPDTTPLNIVAEEFKTKEHVGRTVTISGVELKAIYATSLEIKANTQTISCQGDFTSFMPSKDRIAELSSAGKSPKATIKGVYKEYENGRAVFSPCAISDLEK